MRPAEEACANPEIRGWPWEWQTHSMRLEGLTGLERHEGRLFLAGPWAQLPFYSSPFSPKLVLCALLSPQSLLRAQTSSPAEAALLGPSQLPFLTLKDLRSSSPGFIFVSPLGFCWFPGIFILVFLC